MVLCRYKKTFLKDLAKVHPNYRERIEVLAFEKIPVKRSTASSHDESLVYYR
ncbi:hypothetical protein [Methanoculleus oceani]|uniref:hypothetical protein n=1 Tax=Methanoculleus oceani TaxID=2184756 RepID=UPI002033286D|nr:hypothetical protein [Methanoculleus sp. CWC-02]